MKDAFIKYLKVIGMTEPLQERVKAIYEFFQQICREEIVAIFVNDYISEDGSRVYEDLRFLSEKNSMVAVNFITEDDFRVGLIKDNIVLLRVRKNDYDFKNANERSRINVDTTYEDGTRSEFKASKEIVTILETLCTNTLSQT